MPGCERCGCASEFDEYGDRLCWCDSCQFVGGCGITRLDTALAAGRTSCRSDSDYSDASAQVHIGKNFDSHLFEAFPLLVQYSPFLPTLAGVCRGVRARLTLDKERVLHELFRAQEPCAITQAFIGACAAGDVLTVKQFIHKSESAQSLVNCSSENNSVKPLYRRIPAHELDGDYFDCSPDDDEAGTDGDYLLEIGEKRRAVTTKPLAAAIKANSDMIVQVLINANANIHGVMRKYVVTDLLRNDEYPYNSNRDCRRYYSNSVMLAVQHNAKCVVELLLSNRADVNRLQLIYENEDSDSVCSEYATPLIRSLLACSKDMLRLLLKMGVHTGGVQLVNHTDLHEEQVRFKELRTPLATALIVGIPSLLRELIRSGVSLDGDQVSIRKTQYRIYIADSWGELDQEEETHVDLFLQSPLAAALEAKQVNAVNLLLHARASVNGTQHHRCANKEHATPLLIATIGVPLMARVLDPDALIMSDDKMPETEATSQRLVRLLLDHRAEVNGTQGCIDGRQLNPLTAALRVARHYREDVTRRVGWRSFTTSHHSIKHMKSTTIWSLLREHGATDGYSTEADQHEGVVVEQDVLSTGNRQGNYSRRAVQHARRSTNRAARRAYQAVQEGAWETDGSLE